MYNFFIIRFLKNEIRSLIHAHENIPTVSGFSQEYLTVRKDFTDF